MLRLVELIYDAALDPERWPLFLEHFSDVIGGHYVSFGSVEAMAPALNIFTCVRWDPAARQEYQQYFGQLDPWGAAGNEQRRFVPGVVGLGEEVVSRAELERTEFYNDFGRRYGMEGGLVAMIHRDERSIALLGANSLPGNPFGSDEVQLVTQLLPHLQRAFQVHQRLTRLESETAATAQAFNALTVATVLINLRGEVALVNDAASTILDAQDGLSYRRGRLRASVTRENARLQQLIAECIATTNRKELRAGGAMKVTRAAPKQPLQILVTPLRASNQFVPPGPAGAAIVISDPEQQPVTDADLLRQLHGLTPAEARLALLLASGLTLQEVTDKLQITRNTAHGYLKAIFSKTETRTQAQLVRLVLSMPAIRARR